MDQKKIGLFLKQLRIEKGLTQEQLAEVFHVSSRTVSRWETGTNMPDISLLVPLSNFYEIDVRELMEGEKDSEMNKEIEEVATKMADYADSEKGRLFKWIQIVGFAGVIILTVSVISQSIQYNKETDSVTPILATFLGMLAMLVMTLYSCGVLSKIGKKKKLITAIKVISIGMLVVCLRYILAVSLVLFIGFFSVLQPFKTKKGAEKYDKAAIVEKYGIDMSSDLMVFPDSTDNALDVEFESKLRYGLLDTDGYVILKAKYNEEEYNKEVKRLSEIRNEFVWDFADEYEVISNDILYDDSSYNYPAYIASDGYSDVYEYALLIEENDEIVYVIISYPKWVNMLKYRDYLKKNLRDYNMSNEETFSAYSIYSRNK